MSQDPTKHLQQEAAQELGIIDKRNMDKAILQEHS